MDLALVGADWEISFTDGRERIVGRIAEGVRQQSDGRGATWSTTPELVDNSSGSAPNYR